MTEAPFDIQKAHRRFAVELNNLAWDLLESDNKTEADMEQMVHAAHAACFHWLQVGTVLNHQRAQCLLATVYSSLGYAEAALRHATKCLLLSEQTGEEQTTFDRATAYGCAAQAYSTAHQTDKASKMQQQALKAASAIDNPDDKVVFERLYTRMG